jgi:hypothetical protein
LVDLDVFAVIQHAINNIAYTMGADSNARGENGKISSSMREKCEVRQKK